uniref:Palmitoyltransferase n=1 Tax=Steinernema glaseri TaxID=37863 RepID=A0A1I7YVQ1_9BILA
MLQLLYADEKVPNRFKCCYKRFHVVPMSKMIAVFHGLVFTSALFWYLPQSIYLFPIVPLVFVTAFHGFRSENPAPLIALQLYLTFLVLINVLFAISIFAVSMVDYERLLVFIGHAKNDPWAVKVVLVLSAKIVIGMTSVFCYWHFSIVRACRQYYREQRDQKKYVQLAVPDSFLNTTIEERSRIAPAPPKMTNTA